MSLFFLSLFAFVFGACLGSFLGVLVDRASTGEQVLRGRSKCEHCRKVLETRDLIPIVSYVLLKGRCRHCNSKIPLRVLLIEVTGGMIASGLFLYAYFTGLNIIELILLLAGFFSLVGIFFSVFFYWLFSIFLFPCDFSFNTRARNGVWRRKAFLCNRIISWIS